MKTVRIITGAYGADNGKGGVAVIPRGQTCEVSDAEAQRLISLGVAAMAVATPLEHNRAPDAGVNTSGEDSAQESAEGHLDTEQLSAMSWAQLKRLAEDMGLDVTQCKKKAGLIELIAAEEVSILSDGDDEDGSEKPPDLQAEAPVG